MIIDIGPATILLKAKKDGRVLPLDRSYIEWELKKNLADLRDVLPLMKTKAHMIKNTKRLPEVARRMVDAVKLVDSFSLTPMASVAGAISDLLLEKVKEKWDPDFAYVNNGGDISVYVKDGSAFKVAIGDIRTSNLLRYSFTVSGMKMVGIATSGLGGRSFTLGLCDSVTVFAQNASVADASATYICNATFIESENVKRKKAKEIDPLSDLDEEVVVERGKLSFEELESSLKRGLDAAKRLKELKVIFESFLYIEGLYKTTIDEEAKAIKLEVKNGSKENSYDYRRDLFGW